MKKLYSILSLSLCLGVAASAAPISPQQALDRLRTSVPAKLKSQVSKSEPKLVFTGLVDSKPMTYLFSKGENAGFLLLSADDNAYPLLGYSDSMTLPASPADYPPGFSYWITVMSQQIAACADDAAGGNEILATQFEPIKPMVTTHWNQDAPFNNDCPEVGTRRCYTGCVATALSQILKYHNYPATGTGSHSYQWTPDEGSAAQTLSYDYASASFLWDEMIDNYGRESGASEAAKAQVANLMYACGVAVDMHYGTSESGASTTLVAPAMIEYFNYDKGVTQYYRDYYTLDEWNQLVYNQLKDYGPVQYSGFSNEGGHSFVCDGYDGNGYFHINWGWGGMSDGYFLLTALDPGEQGIGGSTSGFNFSQDIIGNVSTELTTASIDEQIAFENEFYIGAKSVELGKLVEISGGIFNFSSGRIHNVVIGAKLVPENGGDPIYLSGPSVSEWPASVGYAAYNVRIPSDLPEGKYTITPEFRNSQGEWEPILVKVNLNRSYTVDVTGTTATFTIQGNAWISATDFKEHSEFHLDTEFMMSATLSNTTDDEYIGKLLVALFADETSETPYLTALPVAVDIPAHQTQDFEYVSRFKSDESTAPGTYYAYLCQNNGRTYTKLAGPIQVDLKAKSEFKLSGSNFSFAKNQPQTDVKAKIEVTCTEGYFFGQLRLGIAKTVDNYEWQFFDWIYSDYIALQAPSESGSSSSMIKIAGAAPGSQIVSFEGAFDGLNMTEKYACAVYQGNTMLSDLREYVPDVVTSIDQLDDSQSRSVVSVQYYSLLGTNLGDRRPERGVYIVRTTYSDGTETTAKVVK